MMSKIRAIALLILYISTLILSIMLFCTCFIKNILHFEVISLMFLITLIILGIVAVREVVIEEWKE